MYNNNNNNNAIMDTFIKTNKQANINIMVYRQLEVRLIGI